MEIKVLGTGCAGCKALYATVEQVVKELALEAVITKEEDLMKIMEYNVMTLPALVVDGKVVAKGKLSAKEVKDVLRKQRCVTCKAIEKYTKEVVNADLAELVKNGKLRFKEVDISTPEGEKLAEKYRVSWSSLYVNKWKNGKEERNDMTRFGFQNARNNTSAFKKELKQKINQLLK